MRTSQLLEWFSYIIIVCLIWSCANDVSSNKESSKFDKYTEYSTTTYLLQRSDIPDSVFQMKNLQTLSIGGMDCSTQVLAKHIGPNGKPMDTCYTLHEIPLAVGNLKELKLLSLGNDIKEIPPFIKNLTKLEVLSLGGNPIHSLPKEITELKNLRELYLQDCPLDSIAYIEKLPELEKILLQGCPITKLPDDLSNWRKLKLLVLHRTKISKVEELRIKNALPHVRIQLPGGELTK